jgi:DNA-binding FrmR family transcriptional regulator
MRNRNLYFAKIESIEGKLKALQMMVKMGQPVEEFIRVMQDVEDALQDVKDMISREPVGPNEN